jgi:hypothetical protein
MTGNDLKDNFKSTLYVDNEVIRSDNDAYTLPSNIEHVRTIFIITHTQNNPANLAMIDSIAKACKLQSSEYLIISQTVVWSQIRHFNNIKEVIIFGDLENYINIKIRLPLHYCYNFDERIWVKTVDCNTLNTNKDAKTALWNKALKLHFA